MVKFNCTMCHYCTKREGKLWCLQWQEFIKNIYDEVCNYSNIG